MKTILCGTVPSFLRQAFRRNSIEVLELGPCQSLSLPVQGHIDMVCFLLGSRLFVPEEKKAELSALLCTRFGSRPPFTVSAIREQPGPHYPGDVLLNAKSVGNILICRQASTSITLLQAAGEQGLSILDVHQGYAGCSVCHVSDHAVITDDPSIAKALNDGLNFGPNDGSVDCLLIRKGAVHLDGLNYGFIGGASAKIGNTVCFFGNPECHPDWIEIRSFLQYHQTPFAVLGESHPLTDIGGAIELSGSEAEPKTKYNQ